MSFSQVSEALQIPQLDLRQITAALGSGGLVEVVAEDRLQVRPPAIRAVLVRDVFYSGPDSLKIGPLLQGTWSLASTAVVMLGARQRGAMIDHGLLENLSIAADTPKVWDHFAWVDAQCSNAILDRHLEQVCHAAPGLLNYASSRALHALLDADEANRATSATAVEHPRRRISEWLFPIDVDVAPDATIERRRTLLSVLEERVRQSRAGSGASFAWALSEALQATIDTTKPSPRSNREIIRVTGVASHAIIEQIVGLWPRLKMLLYHVPNKAVRTLFDQIENWCLPQRLSLVGTMSKETYALVREHGRQMLSDALAAPNCNRTWKTRAAWIAKWGKLDLQIETDQTFDALYAELDHAEDWEEQQRRRESELRAIADRLIERPMDEILQYLADIRSEAGEFGYRNANGYLRALYDHIAKNCKNPTYWLEALIERNAPTEFLIPFMHRLSSGDAIEYEAALNQLLDCEEYQPLAINMVLRLPTVNEALLSIALALLDDLRVADDLWLRDSGVQIPVMARLLDHRNSSVRAAAAIGEWQRDPAGTIRDELETHWRTAIRDVDPNHYVLKNIFEKDAVLAFEWLQSRIRSGDGRLSLHDCALHDAAKVLDREQRAWLLRLFDRKNYSDDCFDAVIGEHLDLFAEWLQHQSDGYLRLKPLDRDVSPHWERMALLALDAGVSPEELGDHCTPNHWGGSGPLSQHFVERIPIYEALASHSDERLRVAGKRGLEIMRSSAQRHLEQEHREEVYGD